MNLRKINGNEIDLYSNVIERTKVIRVCSESIEFNCGYVLTYLHNQDCCENHYLSFDYVTLSDFDGLYFNLSNNNFFNKIESYGIELIPLNGFSVKIPGYSDNNGYYSDNLFLILLNEKGEKIREIDITECQSEPDSFD